MKHKSLLCLILFLICTSVDNFAQKPAIKYGYITLEELSKSKYDLDTTAEAVVLYEKGIVTYNLDDYDGFYLDNNIHIRKKILKTSALEQGIITLRYYEKNRVAEVISEIEACTYNIENGQVVKSILDAKNIITTKVTSNIYQIKINLPNVKEGSIIEYKYNKQTPLGRVSDKPDTWYFQGNYPTLWSELEVTIPSYFYYQIIMGGYEKLAINTQEKVPVNMGHSQYNTNGIKYNFAVKNAPALLNEPFIATEQDYLTKIEFELSEMAVPNNNKVTYSTTWNDLDKTLIQSENYGGRIRKNNYLKDLVEKFASLPNNKEKLEKVFDYINTNFKAETDYSSLFVGDLKKVYENKKGTSSELNLMMISLLREMGFIANPLILSTRKNGKINENFALIDRFNYTICHVDHEGVKYNIDISNNFLALGVLPPKCLNGKGRLIAKEGGGFVNLNSSEKYNVLESVNLKLDTENSVIRGKYESSGSGYYANQHRNEFLELGEVEMKKKIQKNIENIDISNIEFINYSDKSKPINLKYDFKMEEDIANPEMIYFNPMCQGAIKINPFKNAERKFPVDYNYARDFTYMMKFEVPKEYNVEALPTGISVGIIGRTATFVYSCTHDQATNTISVLSRINIKSPIYSAEQYHELKELYKKIVSKHDEQIVLKHK